MSPITHFLIGWVLLERRVEAKKDKAIVCLAGVAPDVDGLGIVVDFATRTLGLPETDYYQHWHRLLGHGLPAALVFAGIAYALAGAKLRTAVLAFISVHLHFAGDLLGSRGSTPQDLWPIYYFEPVSGALTVTWPYQWPLVGWQNMLLTVGLLAITIVRAARVGYSPLALVSARADAAFVDVIRKRLPGAGPRTG